MRKYNSEDFTWITPAVTNGQKIINARTKTGLSKLELAEKVGVKVRQVRRWENSTSKPSAKALKKLGAIFGKSWKE